jgi:hypothetical protein
VDPRIDAPVYKLCHLLTQDVEYLQPDGGIFQRIDDLCRRLNGFDNSGELIRSRFFLCGRELAGWRFPINHTRRS